MTSKRRIKTQSADNAALATSRRGYNGVVTGVVRFRYTGRGQVAFELFPALYSTRRPIHRGRLPHAVDVNVGLMTAV